MNRIKLGPPGKLTQSLDIEKLSDNSPPGSVGIHPAVIEPFDLQALTGERFVEDRSIFVPLHYEKNYAYPLIVWLHDDGEDEHRLPEWMFEVSARNYLGAAIRGPEAHWGSGYCWPHSPNSVHQTQLAMAAAIDEVCSRFHVDSSRIYLAGIGNGGTMAFRLACREPELFAGIISLNGAFPERHEPLSRLSSCRELPVLWSHARHSPTFSETQLCEQLRLLHICGFPVTLRQYPCDDSLMSQAFNDINLWIMDSINGTDELTSRATEI